jgi:hypothetical protein
MKKKLLLLSFVTFFIFQVFAQPPRPGTTRAPQDPIAASEGALQPLGNPYLDSQYLLQKIDADDIREIVRILVSYGKIPSDSVSFTRVNEILASNIFLKDVLITKVTKIKKYLEESRVDFASHMKKAPEEGAPVTGTSPLSLFSPTKIADGLGTFIAERFKEELTQRYLQAFRDSIVLNNSKYHYDVLLPQTYTALLQYENVFDYRSFMTALKEAFKDDLDNLAPNSLLFIQTLKERNVIKIKDSDFYLLYYLTDFMVNKIPEGQPATSLFLSIDQYDHQGKMNQDVVGYLKTASLITANLVDNSNELEPERIQALLHDKRRLKAFIGLLLEKENGPLKVLTIKGVTAYQHFASSTLEVISPFINSVSNMRLVYKQFQASKKETQDVIKFSAKIAPHLKSLLQSLNVMTDEELTTVFGAIGHVTNIADFSNEQKYGLIITETLALFDDMGLSQTPFFRTFKKYGLFISNVAQAENGQQVKEALDVAALPVGSYKIKRNTFFDISLNAYPGLSAGVEFRSGIPAAADVKSANPILGFSAPVGLGFSWGQVSVKKKASGDTVLTENDFVLWKNNKAIVEYFSGRSHSIFISVLDIGAVTSFRLVKDDTETLPEFKWSNIVAPGVYYVNGLKNTPLSWGLGIQYGPQLRSIEKNGTSLELAESQFSIRAFLAVDIPIFNFYARNTPKKKDK